MISTSDRKLAVELIFVYWYNNCHLHSGINFITPIQRHIGEDIDIMKNRVQTYEEARRKQPQRWSKGIRDWSLSEYVALNPIKEKELKEGLLAEPTTN